MAKSTAKKSSKKNSTKSAAAEKVAKKPETTVKDAVVAEVKETKAKKESAEVKEVKEVIASTPDTCDCGCDEEHPMKGFFKAKHDDENVSNIFKTKKIWGALIGEALGTMFISMLLLTLGIQPLYLVFAIVGVYVAIAGISGAHLNPLVTAGAMATRRISAIRGVLYILAQIIGAWAGLLIINAFRLSSGVNAELPTMAEISGDTFWMAALVELLGAFVIAFVFARTSKYARKNTLAFAFSVASAITLAIILGLVITQSYFSTTDAFMFNPAVALMYQIIPTTADGFGELAGAAGLAIAAYVLFPVIGGICGFFVSEVATRLSGECNCKKECCKK